MRNHLKTKGFFVCAKIPAGDLGGIAWHGCFEGAKNRVNSEGWKEAFGLGIAIFGCMRKKWIFLPILIALLFAPLALEAASPKKQWFRTLVPSYSWQYTKHSLQAFRNLCSLVNEHSGYLWKVEDRDNAEEPRALFVPSSVPLLATPKPMGDIFGSRLEKEFIEKHEQTFGRTSIEQTLNVSNHLSYHYHPGTFNRSVLEANQQQQDFGNFMIRRFGEYHVDNYFRTNPKARGIWELKEKISRVEIEVAPGIKLNSNYSISGNYFDLKFENKYLNTRALLNMNPNSFGPGEIEKTTFMVWKKLSSTVSISSDYIVEEKIFRLIASKRMWRRVKVTLTGAPDLSPDEDREEDGLILGGLSMKF